LTLLLLRDGRRLLLHLKDNLSREVPGLSYRSLGRIMSPDIDAPPVVWDDKPVNLTADQCMAMDAAKAKGRGLPVGCRSKSDAVHSRGRSGEIRNQALGRKQPKAVLSGNGAAR
jgi:hypothetical protein